MVVFFLTHVPSILSPQLHHSIVGMPPRRAVGPGNTGREMQGEEAVDFPAGQRSRECRRYVYYYSPLKIVLPTDANVKAESDRMRMQ